MVPKHPRTTHGRMDCQPRQSNHRPVIRYGHRHQRFSHGIIWLQTPKAISFNLDDVMRYHREGRAYAMLLNSGNFRAEHPFPAAPAILALFPSWTAATPICLFLSMKWHAIFAYLWKKKGKQYGHMAELRPSDRYTTSNHEFFYELQGTSGWEARCLEGPWWHICSSNCQTAA